MMSYHDNSVERQKKPITNMAEGGRYPCRDFNLGLLTYEAKCYQFDQDGGYFHALNEYWTFTDKRIRASFVDLHETAVS
jgi:hypothetical protein